MKGILFLVFFSWGALASEKLEAELGKLHREADERIANHVTSVMINWSTKEPRFHVSPIPAKRASALVLKVDSAEIFAIEQDGTILLEGQPQTDEKKIVRQLLDYAKVLSNFFPAEVRRIGQ